jgi:hypothetical protein
MKPLGRVVTTDPRRTASPRHRAARHTPPARSRRPPRRAPTIAALGVPVIAFNHDMKTLSPAVRASPRAIDARVDQLASPQEGVT